MPKTFAFKETEDDSNQSGSQNSEIDEQNQDNKLNKISDKADHYPSLDEIVKVKEHNRQKFANLPQKYHQGFTYMKTTNSYIMKKCSMPQSLCIIGKPKKQFPSDVIQMITYEKEIGRIALQNDSFQVQRLLTLYMILFNFKNCCFQFKKREGIMKLVKRQSKKELRDQKQYLKGWIQWVISHLSEQDLGICPKSGQKQLNWLAKRQVQELTLYLSKKGQLEEAEFITNIEDEFYRLGVAQIKVSHKFQRILLNDHSDFDHYHWIVRLGTLLWYFFDEEKEGQGFQVHIKKFLTSDSARKQKKLSIELLFLKIYYKIQIKAINQFPHQVSDDLICYYWCLLTKILAKNHVLLQKSLATKVKYFLMNRILKLYTNKNALEILLKEDNEIKKNIQMSLALSRSVTLQSHVDSTVAQTLSQIKQSFENDQYVDCFTQVAQCFKDNKSDSQVKRPLLRLAEQLIYRPQIICNYREGESKKVLQSMLTIKDLSQGQKNALSKVFHDILFYLEIKLNIVTDIEDKKQIERIVSLLKTAQRLEKYETVIRRIVYNRIISDKMLLLQILQQGDLLQNLMSLAELSEEGRIFKILTITSKI